MRAVTPAIIKAIIELQTLPTVSKFNLGGGTNLALQFNHIQRKIALAIMQKALMILAI